LRDQDLETLRTVFGHTAEGDFGSPVLCYDPSVEWIETRGIPGHGSYRGLSSLREGFSEWLSVWERYRLELVELIDAGGCAVAEVRGSGRGRMSGADASEVFFQVWTFHDGRVVRIENYRTREEALAAAAVSAGDGER
jgi:ketosteroid isomerase-like protein